MSVYSLYDVAILAQDTLLKILCSALVSAACAMADAVKARRVAKEAQERVAMPPPPTLSPRTLQAKGVTPGKVSGEVPVSAKGTAAAKNKPRPLPKSFSLATPKLEASKRSAATPELEPKRHNSSMAMEQDEALLNLAMQKGLLSPAPQTSKVPPLPAFTEPTGAPSSAPTSDPTLTALEALLRPVNEKTARSHLANARGQNLHLLAH